MLKFREKLFAKANSRAREEGAGDLVTIVFILIILVQLLIAFVVLSGYFQVRNQIQQQASAGARQVAIYGGYNAGIPLNTGKVAVPKTILSRIDPTGTVGGCTFSRCSQVPGVTCQILDANGVPTTKQYADSLSQVARCTITYYYEPYENDGFGFALGARKAFTVSATYAVETYYQKSPY